MKVKVKSSPYHDIKRKAIGEVVFIQFKGTVHEVWRVQVKGNSRLFYPSELEVLNA